MLGQFVPEGLALGKKSFFHRIVLFLFLRDAALFISSIKVMYLVISTNISLMASSSKVGV